MANPLSPTRNTRLNISTPPTSHRYDNSGIQNYAMGSSHEAVDSGEESSSPFVSLVKDDQENHSPSGSRPGSRILSGTELSPLKILQDRHHRSSPAAGGDAATPAPTPSAHNPAPRSSRKLTSPEKRFPIKVSAGLEAAAAAPASCAGHEKRAAPEEAVRESEGLKHAISIFEDEGEGEDEDEDEGEDEDEDEGEDEDGALGDGPSDHTDSTAVGADHQEELCEDEPAGADDTMISTFSNFSAVPSLATLARAQSHSPATASIRGGPTPRAKADLTPSRTSRGCPPPDRSATHSDNPNNTTSLIDLTEQLRAGTYRSQSPLWRGNPSAGPDAVGVAATPQRNNLVSLLDFDIPPLPTPRSIPTVTPRELESLKSGFLSEISSLKASLSGKEAEVSSLKTAVGDAEKRVGECMEQLREVRGQNETLAVERDGWDRRGREMDAVLRKVREEIVLGQRERDELEAKLEEADKRREAAEMMAQEAESKMAGMRSGKAHAAPGGDAAASSPPSSCSPLSPASEAAAASGREVDVAVERVARELHALYKSKHETKVAALKKSYEARWEKKVRELQGRVDELARENEELRAGRDATMARVDPARLAELEAEREAERARDAAQIRGLEAEVERAGAVALAVRRENDDLRGMLEQERVEKGELVLLAEEMMSMQQTFVAASGDGAAGGKTPKAAAGHHKTPSAATRAPQSPARAPAAEGPAAATPTSFRSSFRASGLRAPGTGPGPSRIGRVAVASAHERTKSSGSAASGHRPGSGMAVRSGIMSSIEKMGSYRSRGE